MRINARGHAVHGELSTSLDGMPLLPGVRATQPDWLTETEVGYQVQRDGRWSLEVCDVKTRTTRPLDPGPANLFAARAGVWAAWGPAGVRSNAHPFLPGAGLWGVGHDGCLAYCRSQQQGTGIVLRALDGTTHEYAIGSGVLDPHIVDAGTACYTSRYRLQTIGVPAGVTVADQIFQPRLIRLPFGVWWLCYHTPDRLLLQPLADPVGYVVEDAPTTFDPDAVALDASTIRVVWSTTPGAAAAAFRRVDVDLTAPRVELRPAPPPVVPPVAERPRITITQYTPMRGAVPLTVTAVCALSGGPATRIFWRQRLRGDLPWVRVANNPPTDPDHHFVFTATGTYEIGVDVVGPGGSDSTARPRIIEVT